jgi:hypothetical protein
MAKKEIGDIHAPVEDVDVPLTLKVLVVAMFFVIVGLGVLLVMSIGLVPIGQ